MPPNRKMGTSKMGGIRVFVFVDTWETWLGFCWVRGDTWLMALMVDL